MNAIIKKVTLFIFIGLILSACNGGGSSGGSSPVSLEVTNAAPLPGSTTSNLATAVSITFNVSLDPVTVTANNIKVFNNQTQQFIPIQSISLNSDNTEAVVTFTNLLESGNTYTVSAQNVASTNGTVLAGIYSFNFSTSGTSDTTAPVVASISPILTNPNSVSLSPVFLVTFSKSMAATTLIAANVVLTKVQDSTVVPLFCTAGNPTNTMTCILQSGSLAQNTTYAFTLSNAITDTAGNPLSGTLNYTLTTTTTAPTVVLTSPALGSQNVDTSTESIILTFSESMNSSTINANTVFVKATDSSANLVTSCNAIATPYAYACILNSPVGYNNTYQVTVTTGVQNLSNLGLTTDYTAIFSTATHLVPNVLSTTPVNNATGIPTGVGSVTITFNESMDASTINSTNITLQASAADSNHLAFGLCTPNIDNTVFTCAITGMLAYATSYTLTVTTNVQDEVGIPLVANTITVFTTQQLASANIVGCTSQTPFQCYVSNSADLSGWYIVPGITSGTLQTSGVAMNINGKIVACNNESPALCYYSNNGAIWNVIPGSIPGSVAWGGLMIDPNDNITACSNSTASSTSSFTCYRSANGGAWSAINNTGAVIPSNATLAVGGMIVDINGNLTACTNSSTPFACYRSTNGNSWVAIATGTTAGAFALANITVDAFGNITACNGANPFICYRSVNGAAWTTITGAAANLTYGGVFADSLGNVVACNTASPVGCYRSVGGTAFGAAIAGTVGNMVFGDLVVDSNGNIVVCNNAIPFACYRSVAGAAFTALPTTASGNLFIGSLVVDSTGAVTACNQAAPFICYRSVSGGGTLLPISGMVSGALQIGGVATRFSNGRGR